MAVGMVLSQEMDITEFLTSAADNPAPYELIVRASDLESAQILALQLQTIKEYLEHSFDGVKNAVELAPLFEFTVFTSSIVHFADKVSDYWLLIIQADAVILLIRALEDFLEQNDEFRETWLSEGQKTIESKKKFKRLDIDSYGVTPPQEMRSIPRPILKMALVILYGSKRAGKIDGFLQSGWMYEEVGSIEGGQKGDKVDQDSKVLLPIEMSQQIFSLDAKELANARTQVAKLKRPLKVGEQSLRRLQLAISFVHQVGWDTLPYLHGVVGRE